jgi:FkbM family methyltransferase
MSINYRKWYFSHNIYKRKAINYFGKIKSYIYLRPILFTGKLIGKIFSLMPIHFSASVKENIKVSIKMPMSYDIKVVVDRPRDIKRAKFCYKEKSTVLWIEKYYQKEDVIFDVGANIGAVSLISAAYLKKQCKIYAFEPLPTTFSMLFQNIMTNSLSHVITPINIALSDKVKVDDFILSSIDAGTSGHSIKGGTSKEEENDVVSASKLEILTTTIDQLKKDYRINDINHLKIDVDGCDYEVLLGGEGVLSNPSLKTILVERNDKENNVVDLLNKYGFKQVEIAPFYDAGTRENMGFVRL